MGKMSKFYNMLGNNKKEKFTRLMMMFAMIGLFTMLIINVGYDKKQGCYWKPADIHINKKIGTSENDE